MDDIIKYISNTTLSGTYVIQKYIGLLQKMTSPCFVYVFHTVFVVVYFSRATSVDLQLQVRHPTVVFGDRLEPSHSLVLQDFIPANLQSTIQGRFTARVRSTCTQIMLSLFFTCVFIYHNYLRRYRAVHLSNVAVQQHYLNGKRHDKLPENNFMTSENFVEYLEYVRVHV